MKNGFTLAEVLITLTILGIVAGIGMSSIVQNYKKRITIVKLQKAYETLEKAAVNIKIATGCGNLTCTGLLNTGTRNERQNKFVELSGLNLKNKTNIKSRIMNMYCENPANKCNDTKGYNISSDAIYSVSKDGIGYYISSGTYIHSEKTEKAKTGSANGFFIIVFTDLKAPNTQMKLKMGRNSFFLVMYDDFNVDMLVPGFGGSFFPLSNVGSTNWSSKTDVDKYCSISDASNDSGKSCAAKIIKDGWKINY